MCNGRRKDIDLSGIFHSNNYGDFIFLDEIEPTTYIGKDGHHHNHRRYRIQFILTGTIIETEMDAALKGAVRDYYYPSVLGIACMGNVSPEDAKRYYSIWRGIIARCKFPRNETERRIYEKVDVCDRWLCLENFVEDIKKLPGYEEMIANPDVEYALDKDTLQQGCEYKIYSPETCIWLTKSENSQRVMLDHHHERKNKYFGVTEVYGNKYQVCRDVISPYGSLGSYDSEIAAVNIREWYRPIYSPNAIPNTDYPKMPLDEASTHRMHKGNPKYLYKLIDKGKEEK